VDGVKLLGNGEVTKKFFLKNILVSQSTKEKIETAGGSVE
jgi:large subunit ribosomal protein L15